jgi:hypothetical protein
MSELLEISYQPTNSLTAPCNLPFLIAVELPK